MRRILHVLCCVGIFASAHILASDTPIKNNVNFSQPFIDATKKAQPSVVSIKCKIKKQAHRSWQRGEGEDFSPEDFWERFFGLNPEKKQQPKQITVLGSGFIVSSDGLVLTNNHVVEDAEEITVQLPGGKEYPAKKMGTDPSTDIALLKINETRLPFLTFADSSKVDTCEWVIAIGNPLGLQASVTTGVISAQGRSDFEVLKVEKFLQTDAAINQGNSGGPLVNLSGEVVGMNTALVSHTGGYMGIGFAIPSNLLKEVMQDLIEHGQLVRGYLGVVLQRVDADIAAAVGFDRPHGALVSEVAPGGPADAAGLQSGDIILELQGSSVDSLGSFRNTIALAKPGQEVSMKVYREGKELMLTAKIGQNPEHSSNGLKIEDFLGLILEPVTADLAKQYHLDTQSGLLITQIDPDGIAFLSGLRAGYVVLAVNGKSVSSVDDFVSIMEKAEKGGKILLQVKIGQSIRFFSLPVE